MDIEAIWTAIGKYVSIWIAFIILIMSITACGRKDTRDIVSEVLSLTPTAGTGTVLPVLCFILRRMRF